MVKPKPTPKQKPITKPKLSSGKKDQCTKGNSCGEACISTEKKCRVTLKNARPVLNKMSSTRAAATGKDSARFGSRGRFDSKASDDIKSATKSYEDYLKTDERKLNRLISGQDFLSDVSAKLTPDQRKVVSQSDKAVRGYLESDLGKRQIEDAINNYNTKPNHKVLGDLLHESMADHRRKGTKSAYDAALDNISAELGYDRYDSILTAKRNAQRYALDALIKATNNKYCK